MFEAEDPEAISRAVAGKSHLDYHRGTKSRPEGGKVNPHRGAGKNSGKEK